LGWLAELRDHLVIAFKVKLHMEHDVVYVEVVVTFCVTTKATGGSRWNTSVVI